MKNAPFMKISDAARAVGVSQYYLRNGCKDGTVPHIKSGTVYMINVPALLRKLDAESTVQTEAGFPLQERDERGKRN